EAMGERWNGGAPTCNSYNYGFANVQVSNAPRGSWLPAKILGYAWNDKQDETLKTSATAFVARSRGLTSAAKFANDVPPLLGWLASKLTGKHLTATCANQKKPGAEQPSGLPVRGERVCEPLIGSALAEPGAPDAATGPGKFVARTTLAFLRGVDDVAPKPADPDCHALQAFTTALPDIGATP